MKLLELYDGWKQSVAEKFSLKKSVQTGVVPTTEIRNGLYSLYTYEFTDLTADALREYLEMARVGIPFYMYALFGDMRRKDLRIGTVLLRRKLSVLDEEWRIECEDEEMKEFGETIISSITDFDSVMAKMVEANMLGIKMFEIDYGIVSGKVMPYRLTAINNTLYYYNHNTGEFGLIDPNAANGSDIRSWGMSAMNERFDFSVIKKLEVEPIKILKLEGLDGDEKNCFMNGLTLAFIIANFWKVFNEKDMMIYIERFASPQVDAAYDPLDNTAKTEMMNAVKGLKNFGSIVRPMGSEVKYLNDEQKGTAAEIFIKAIDFWNQEMTMRCLGEAETTQMGKTGSFAALKVKKYVSEDFSTGDLKVIQQGVNEIIKRTCDINFANVREYPTFKFVKIKTLEDKKIQSEINLNLKSAGWKVHKETVEEQFDLEVEEDSGSGSGSGGESSSGGKEEDKGEKDKNGFEDYAAQYIKSLNKVF
jgi:phage gp29-like protein